MLRDAGSIPAASTTSPLAFHRKRRSSLYCAATLLTSATARRRGRASFSNGTHVVLSLPLTNASPNSMIVAW